MAGVIPKFAVRPATFPSVGPCGTGALSWETIAGAQYRCRWLGQDDLLQDFDALLFTFTTDWFWQEPSCGPPASPEDVAIFEELIEEDREIFDDQLYEIIDFEFVLVREIDVPDYPGPGPISEDEFSELVPSC